MDVDALRGTGVWDVLWALLLRDAEDAQSLKELAARSGFDPRADLSKVVLGFPGEIQNVGPYALVAQGRKLDERRLIAFARDQAGLQGRDLQPRQLHGVRLWADSSTRETEGFFASPGFFALGRAGWADEMAALSARAAPGTAGLRGNRQMSNLLVRVLDQRAAGTQSPPAVWAAAVVPGDLRTQLERDARFADAASIDRVLLVLIPGDEWVVRLTAELASEAAAARFSSSVLACLRAARQNAEVLLWGLSPYLEAVEVVAKGPHARLEMRLSEQQVAELLQNLVTQVKTRAR